MKAYLDIVANVINNGKWKSPVRKNDEGEFISVDGGIRTLALPNQHFSHNMANGFPLLTTKKMPFRTICVELEGFIKGITSKGWYQDRKCKIWNEWANPRVVDNFIQAQYGGPNIDYTPRSPDDYNSMRKQVQLVEDDLGPIYGYQWRRFNEVYDQDDEGCLMGYDQFANVLHTLKNNPHDRRMVVSAWNPHQISRMALPPCHLLWVVTVIDGELSLHWTQRSCDLMLGVPFNIASYGVLLELLAEYAGLKPGNLSGMLCDCHIYENQIDVAKEQLSRIPKQLPKFRQYYKHDVTNWDHSMVGLADYYPHPKLNFGAVTI